MSDMRGVIEEDRAWIMDRAWQGIELPRTEVIRSAVYAVAFRRAVYSEGRSLVDMCRESMAWGEMWHWASVLMSSLEYTLADMNDILGVGGNVQRFFVERMGMTPAQAEATDEFAWRTADAVYAMLDWEACEMADFENHMDEVLESMEVDE